LSGRRLALLPAAPAASSDEREEVEGGGGGGGSLFSSFSFGGDRSSCIGCGADSGADGGSDSPRRVARQREEEAAAAAAAACMLLLSSYARTAQTQQALWPQPSRPAASMPGLPAAAVQKADEPQAPSPPPCRYLAGSDGNEAAAGIDSAVCGCPGLLLLAPSASPLSLALALTVGGATSAADPGTSASYGAGFFGPCSPMAQEDPPTPYWRSPAAASAAERQAQGMSLLAEAATLALGSGASSGGGGGMQGTPDSSARR
jgi:hypothetical protein